MNGDNTDKRHESYKIPARQQAQEGGAAKALPQTKNATQNSLSDGLFYEIEYGSCPIEGVGKFVLKPQKIEPPEKDDIRELFNSMRDIAGQYRSPFSNDSRFFDRRVHQDNALIFYKQAVFMKDFEDDYPQQVPFSSYFPYYQMLNYEQLRTYFTWRTNVRKGVINKTSLSYVFLYVYELLNNVGVSCPQTGLDLLMSFWKSFQEHDSALDKYVLGWLKDYHIYYNLHQTFKPFAKEHDLSTHYPKIVDRENSFDLFCAISKYDIRKSVFFSDEKSKLITDCFDFVIQKIRQDFEMAGIQFDDALFHPTKKLITWKPFKNALFYPWLQQPNRSVVISEHEIYICSKNEWTFSSIITTDQGRQFVGYVMKQMESVLRKLTNYKHRITANINMVSQEMLSKLKESGLFIDSIVQDGVIEFYSKATRTVVSVDHVLLARIRQEALATQESLIVEEQMPDQNIFADPSDTEPAPVYDGWESLRDALSEIELRALVIILQGGNIKKIADSKNTMLEVLVEGINEKAMDYVGDNILDEELAIYQDYEEQVKGMVEKL